MRIDKKKIHQPAKRSGQTQDAMKGKSLHFKEATKSAVKGFTRTETLGRLLKSLRPALNNMKPVMKSPLFSALPPLQQILTFFDNPQLNPGDRDLVLLEKFITSWLEKYGGSLPGARKKELTELANLLRNNNSQHPPVYIAGPIAERQDRWKLSFKKEEPHGVETDDDDAVSCSLQVTTGSLGKVSVMLSQGKMGRQCLFRSPDQKVRSLLAQNLNRFRRQLENHGWEIPLIKVRPEIESVAEPEAKDNKGVDLWG